MVHRCIWSTVYLLVAVIKLQSINQSVNLGCVLATPTKNCFGCWSLVLLFRLNDNRVVSSVTVLVVTSETVFGWGRQNALLGSILGVPVGWDVRCFIPISNKPMLFDRMGDTTSWIFRVKIVHFKFNSSRPYLTKRLRLRLHLLLRLLLRTSHTSTHGDAVIKPYP